MAAIIPIPTDGGEFMLLIRMKMLIPLVFGGRDGCMCSKCLLEGKVLNITTTRKLIVSHRWNGRTRHILYIRSSGTRWKRTSLWNSFTSFEQSFHTTGKYHVWTFIIPFHDTTFQWHGEKCMTRQKVYCDFPDIDDAIRDQVIKKCYFKRLRRKLLERYNVTLQQVREIS